MNVRVDKIKNYLINTQGVDRILSITELPSFVECVCDIGGDIITYRAYDKNNGIVLCER